MKRYRIHDGIRAWEADLSESEVEKLQGQFHGFVSITEVAPSGEFDFSTLAQEIHERVNFPALDFEQIAQEISHE